MAGSGGCEDTESPWVTLVSNASMTGREAPRVCDSAASDGGEVDNGSESNLVGGDVNACGGDGRTSDDEAS